MRTNTAADGATARDPLDRCYTDPLLSAALVAWLYAEGLSKTARIAEPGVGDGSILSALLAAGHDPDAITVVDLDPTAPGLAIAVRAGVVAVRASFLDLVGGVAAPWHDPAPFDLVLGNPPYSGATAGHVDGAEAFVRAGLVVAPSVVYLQPLLFLGGADREADGLYLRLRHVEALSPRPKFHGPGVRSKDPTKKPGGAQMEYGAFTWDRLERDRPSWTGGHTRWRPGRSRAERALERDRNMARRVKRATL